MSTSYEYAHSHTYEYQGQTLVLEPIAILKVDDTHPFPSDQGLNLVQIAELGDLAVTLAINLLVKLGNLLDIGAVPQPSGQDALSAVAATVVERAGVEDKLRELDQHIRSLTGLQATVGLLARGSNAAEPDAAAQDVAKSLTGEIEQFLKWVVELLASAIGRLAGLVGTPKNIDQYATQFQTIVVPDVISTWSSDDEFGRMRVAGPNPLVIERVREALPGNFPVLDANYRRVMGEDDSIAQAIEQQRLYLTNYAALEVMTNGKVPEQKYITAPLALFAIPKGTTGQVLPQPVAIQCYQQPSNTNPIFHPFDGDAWVQAKVHVQVADGNYHELISHLGLTHLLIEPFVVSSFRKLPSKHPLLTLLLPHFQGTLFINNAAVTSLIDPGGIVDRLLAGEITSDWRVTTNALGNLDFDAWMLPNELRARGVDSSELPLAYPYRDDALAVWGAIEQWTHDYLALFYDNDRAVADDSALQAWVSDLASLEGGGIRGLGQTRDNVLGIYTFDYLVSVITMVIFTGSAQHAAVNFPQASIMSYTPAMPLAAFAEPPHRTSGVDSTLLETLPPLQQGLLQLLVGQGLGGVYFTRLGDYNRHQLLPYFKLPSVARALGTFQANLAQVEREIGQRNLKRPAYTQLLPSRIPQSINI
jgi:arachidonate 15-lipoxygenase